MTPANKILFLIFIILCPTTFSQVNPYTKEGLELVKSNLEFLASDSLEGRETATNGSWLASSFIASELERYNVKPFGDNGTYFQNFDVLVKRYDANTNISIFKDEDLLEKLSIGDDFYISKKHLPSLEHSNNKRAIVFAGYGITADAYNYNDYKDADVNGKIVLLLQGLPVLGGKIFFTDEDAKLFKSEEFKLKIATEHGAAGIFLIPAELNIKYWKYLKSGATENSVEIFNEDTNNIMVDGGSIPLIKLSEEAVKKIMDGEKYDYKKIKKSVEENKLPGPFQLTKQVIVYYKYYAAIKQARNVIGIIEGKNEKLKDQYVTMSAHYDHEGIVDGEIYNGADDNASGVTAILESARRLSLTGQNERPVLVIFHTGEEKGLLGSKYFTNHVDFIKDIVVNINMDMVGREETDHIYCIGSDKLSTELFNLVEEVNRETSRFKLDYKYNDPFDPNRYYYRSDHYNYARQNIPIVFFYDHMTEDYHKPTDDAERINFPKIEKCSTMITRLALRISNLNHRLIVDKKDK